MKKTLLTVALATASVAAFAQGRISLQTDSGALVTLAAGAGSPSSNGDGLTLHPLAADAAYYGLPIPTTSQLPSGITLDVGLYGGTSSGSLTLLTTVVLDPNALSPQNGQYPSTKITLPWAGGSVDYFQVQVWNAADAVPGYLAALALGTYGGENHEFAMTPSTSAIASPGVNNGGGTTWSTVGNENPLYVGLIPEPTTFALAGLGAAALVIFRRRK